MVHEGPFLKTLQATHIKYSLRKTVCVCVCVCALSVSHYVPALSAISHCSLNRKIQHFLLLISLSEQMTPEIFILFIMEFQWPLLQIKWKFLHIKWEKLNVNHVLM